jgi:hypothetical protein
MKWRTTLYRLTFPDGKVYIGVTGNPQQRWAARYKGTPCGEAISKFGWENVKKEIIISLEPNVHNHTEVARLEREFIKLYGKNSYNRTTWVGHFTADRYHGKTIVCNGEEKTYAQWRNDPRVTVSMSTIRNRIERQGWSVEDALFTPPLKSCRA